MVKSAPMVDDKQFQFDSDDKKFYWRIDMTPPVLRAGWQTDQSANSKDLTFNFNPKSFQSNPRIGPTVTGGAIFSLPTNSRHSGLATVAAPTPLNCNNYFSCFAGTTANVVAPATGAAVVSIATSKVPCFPST